MSIPTYMNTRVKGGTITTVFNDGVYTDHFKEWSSIYIACYYIDNGVFLTRYQIRYAYERSTGRNPELPKHYGWGIHM